jgi:hypothetical protein
MGKGNPQTGQCEEVTTHDEWIREEKNARSIGLPDHYYRQIKLLPNSAIDETRTTALVGGLVRIRQHKRYTSIQFWSVSDQVEGILQAVVKGLQQLQVHPDELLKVDNLSLGKSESITLRELQASDQAVCQ